MNRRSKTPAAPADNRLVVSKDGTPLAKVRRSPSVVAFLTAGFVVGAIVGAVLALGGGEGNYTASSALGYFIVLFGGLGTLLGGVAFVLADRRR